MTVVAFRSRSRRAHLDAQLVGRLRAHQRDDTEVAAGQLDLCHHPSRLTAVTIPANRLRALDVADRPSEAISGSRSSADSTRWLCWRSKVIRPSASQRPERVDADARGLGHFADPQILRHGAQSRFEPVPEPLIALLCGFVIALVTTPVGVSGAVFLLPVQLDLLKVPNPSVTPTNLLYNVVSGPGALLRHRARLRGSLVGRLLVRHRAGRGRGRLRPGLAGP